MATIEAGRWVEWPVAMPSGKGGRLTGRVLSIDNGYATIEHTVQGEDGRPAVARTVVAVQQCRPLDPNPRFP